MAMLSSEEQEAIIGQADAHLKRAKGKAMLPRLTKKDVYEILEDIPPNAVDGSCTGAKGDGLICFHQAQSVILQYRAERIKQYKLVYPTLTKKSKDTSSFGSTALVNSGGETGPAVGVFTNASMSTTVSLDAMKTEALDQAVDATVRRKKAIKKGRVSEAVAPKTMFLHFKGASNSDIIETTNRYLHTHAYKISTLDTANSSSMTSNVRLLREIVPLCPNPYLDRKTGKDYREPWDITSNMKGTHVGSLVQCAASSTTAKRNTTAY